MLSARQVDLDRALATPEGARRLPLAALKAFVEPLGVVLSAAISGAARHRRSTRVTLASGTLQNVRGDLKLDADGWDIETLEFRAPGFAQVRLSGRVAAGPQGVTFKGPAQIEASDPKLFLAWLEGREAGQRQSGVLRACGDLTIGAQQFAVDRLKFEFDRKTIEGRIAYAADGARPRLDAELKAGELDVDSVLGVRARGVRRTVRSSGRAILRSRLISARANVAGVDVKGVSGTFKLDPAGITFDRVRIADLGDAAFNLNGRMEGALDAPRGTVTFDVDARGLDGTVAVLAKYLPEAAETGAPRGGADRAAEDARDARRRAGVLDRSGRHQQDQARARRHGRARCA